MQHSQNALTELEGRLGYTFKDRSLLETALTHTSFAKGDGKKALHNERLEYLGDAVLEFVVTDHLYRSHPDMQEGGMTRARARLVCEDALFEAARKAGLPACLRLGRGMEAAGGRDKPSIVSDAFEAVIGAIYLDGGLRAAKKFVSGCVIRPLENARVDTDNRDYKTRLQEYVAHDHIGALEYVLQGESGPEHDKRFHMAVLLSGREIGVGEGVNKQAAGQEAAKRALALLQTPGCGV